MTSPYDKAIRHAKQCARRGLGVESCGYKATTWRSAWLKAYEEEKQMNFDDFETDVKTAEAKLNETSDTKTDQLVGLKTVWFFQTLTAIPMVPPSAAATPLRKGAFLVGGNVVGLGDCHCRAFGLLETGFRGLLGRFLLRTLFRGGGEFFLGHPPFPILLLLSLIFRHLAILRQWGDLLVVVPAVSVMRSEVILPEPCPPR